MIQKILLAAVLLGAVPAAALAQQSTTAFSTSAQSGTPEQRAACRPDVRKFCRKVRPEEGDMGYLACLKANRVKLSKACRNLLESHGQ